MMRSIACLLAVLAGLATLPAAAQQNYFGVLKPPQGSLEPRGFYALATGPTFDAAPTLADGHRLKLGFRQSRFLAIEGEFVDVSRPSFDPFAHPGNLASGFRSTGFGIDTVATLPISRLSFYGKLGAYRGEGRGIPGIYSTSLLPEPGLRNTRWRYGLGVRYDFTKAFGVRAEFERYGHSGATSLAPDTEADHLSVGISWRF